MIRISDLFLYALAAGFFYLFYIIVYQYTFWRRRRVPFIDTAPILGHGLAVARKKVPVFDHFKGLHFNCPETRYYGLHDFNCPGLLIRDPEIIREVCIKAADYFPNHRQIVNSEIDPILSRNLFALKDQRWKSMRNTLTPSFTASKMKLMFGLIDDCAKEFTDYLKDNPDMTKEVEAKDAFTKFTCDAIASAAFGIRVNTLKNPDNDFYRAGMELANFTFFKFYKAMMVGALPFLKNFMEASIISSRTTHFFDNLIQNTIKERKERGIMRPDMVQLMMEASERENGIEISKDDITANCFIFFLGGFDTSSNFMCLMSYELAGNPHIQEKLRKEIDNYFDSKPADWDQRVTYDDVNKLKYLDMVLNETLRYYPPALMTDRVCSKEYQLPEPVEGCPGYKVEKGMVLFISVGGLHHDPKYFVDPHKFDPERFSEERKHEINPYAYIPFGVGPRRCIGDRFALMENKILFVRLIRNFEIKLSPKTKYPMVFDKASVNMRPENGFIISLVARKKIN